MMKRNKNPRMPAAACLAAMLLPLLASCGAHPDPNQNVVITEEEPERLVNLFSPMEKTDPNAENTARSASDTTVAMAEEELGVIVAYRTYTAENYQDKTYDDVSLDRARNNMDDIYLLNPDTILALGSEGVLMDLSGLESAKNLRDVVKTANTVDGKLVAIPQEVVAYGLFVNKDMFDQYQLELPQTPRNSWNAAVYFRKTALKRLSAQTAGGWRPLSLHRRTPICITAEIRKRRLRRSTAEKPNTATICGPALNSFRS